MAIIRPFRALRPRPADAARVAAVPYDVVNTEEARRLAEGNPLSFLHVSRAEIDLPAGIDPHSNAVYDAAANNFRRLKEIALVVEDEPSLYFYRLRMGDHTQMGLAGCYSIDEYDADVIKKHERTRRDKEDDRTHHMLALGAQTGPVFLTYRASADVTDVGRRVVEGEPLFDFSAVDGVSHTIWRVAGANRQLLVNAFSRVSTLYIADGHHRAASAARARVDIKQSGTQQHALGDGADANTFLAVAFPHDQVQILAYNRIVKDLAGLSPTAFLTAVGERFSISDGPASPERPGDIAMYFQARWQTLHPRKQPNPADTIGALDVSVLQDQLLGPVLKILDVRTDTRIDFVGGARGTGELESHVRTGRAAVAFSLHPVGVADLMAVSDADEIMPPKSTWFEPKLRDGLLSHLI